MTIQWFPGHMLETERFLKQAISSVDVVMEILDARLPASSANPILGSICQNVLRIKLLNKKDLADPEITCQWLTHFKMQGEASVAINGTDTSDTWRAAENALAGVNKGKARRIRVMVAGIPNTGKSTIINTLAGKKIAKTGNTPAITRQQQRTSLKNKVDIYDTPGILWPILKNKKGALRLAASGAISDTAIDYAEIAIFTLSFLMERYPERLNDRYDLDIASSVGSPLTQAPDANPLATVRATPSDGGSIAAFSPIGTASSDPLALLEAIGKKRGCLKKGGIIDYQKASELLIREVRSGKLGRITLETPEEALSEREALNAMASPEELGNK